MKCGHRSKPEVVLAQRNLTHMVVNFKSSDVNRFFFDNLARQTCLVEGDGAQASDN